MARIISVLFLAYFVAAKTRLTFPITSDKNYLIDKPKKAETKVNYRLPGEVVPISYTINLTVDLENFKYDGEVYIKLDVVKNVAGAITLHAGKDIEIVTIFDEQKALKHKRDATTEFLKVEVGTLKKMTQKLLNITFTAPLKDGTIPKNRRGFYRSSYKNEKGDQVWLAATHFEPVGARLAIPCFDEPALKAEFMLTIVNNIKYKAIANMAVSKEEEKDSLRTTTFEKTNKMSSYLLAFVVSDFATLSNDTADFKHTVHANPAAINNSALALEKGQQILKELDTFTGIPFSQYIKKMDQIGIPDFNAGAMENWGLVTYSERSLLFDKDTSTTNEKQTIVETIAHEFAHQWFGDLVSPKWWRDLWLNEGFANFFQSYITEKVEPKWRSIDQAVVKSIQARAMEFDSTNETHPMNVDVESPKEISDIFDTISYQKSGAVIRMMQHFVTEDTFREGLRQYLKDRKLNVANSDDLFASIHKVVKEKEKDLIVKDIMNTWVNSKGYPVVKVERNYTTGEITLTQKRFLTYASKEEGETKYVWHIPINYVIQGGEPQEFEDTKATYWLKKESDKIKPGIKGDQWLILNKQQTGYYRVNYDDKNWELIIDYLNNNASTIHVLNRAQLMNDALAFVKQEQLNVKTLLSLIDHLKNETDYIAWVPGFTIFSWLEHKLLNTEHHSAFKKYIVSTTKALVDAVKFNESDTEEHLTKLNRIQALKLACLADDQDCLDHSHNKVKEWLETKKISPDLKPTLLCYGLRNAEFDIWQNVLEICKNSSDSTEALQLIQALGCSFNQTILKQYLDESLNYPSAPLNDSLSVVNSVLQQSTGVDVVIDFLIENLIPLLIKDRDRMSQYFNSLGRQITTETQLQKLKNAQQKETSLKTVMEDAMKLAESNVNWLEKNKDALESWVKDQTPTPAPEPAPGSNNGVGLISESLSLISILLVTIHVTAK